MQLNVPPDLEMLIKKRLSSGGYTHAQESLTDEERQALSAYIEEGLKTDRTRQA